MSMSLDLLVHVSGGSIALVSAVIALICKKGGLFHRQEGKLYVLSMLIMASTGAFIAYTESVYITVLAGSLSLYLVLSGWISGNKQKINTLFYQACILTYGLLVLILSFYLSWRAFNGVTDELPGYTVPAEGYFVFAGFALMAVVGDIIVLIKGGVFGRYRIARHAWRMCIPLYIATSSLFSGQEQIFPEALQGTIYLQIPLYTVLLAMIFWLAMVWLSARFLYVDKKVMSSVSSVNLEYQLPR